MGFSGVRVNKVDMGFSGVRVNRSVVVCVCFVDRCLSLVLYLLVIVLSVVLRLRILITPLVSSNSSYVLIRSICTLFAIYK
jgi:hypothetical protein